MRYGTPKIEALARSLDLLEAIIADGGAASTLMIAAAIGMPHTTAHRIVRTLSAAGFLAEISRGRHVAGARLRGLAGHISGWQVISAVSRGILAKAAAKYRCIAHLGVLQDGMVTYLVKEGTAVGGVFTREGSQLEAYCSALGKVLLAQLPPDERDSYLASGPFVPLTETTITDPALLREELDQAARYQIAWDREEVAAGLICCAAPIDGSDGSIRAAVSLSFNKSTYLEFGAIAISRAVCRVAGQLTRAASALPFERV